MLKIKPSILKILSHIYCMCVFTLISITPIYAVYGTAPTSPTTLLCESQTNPTGVTDTTPEFSAIFQDPDVNDLGQYYRIQVNTSSTFSALTMVWDSTKKAMTDTAIGARSPDISYAGSNLSLDGRLYYWRIKFWDRYDTEGAWSATASFRMNYPPGLPSSLLLNDASNPTNVTSLTPYFSAIFKDSDPGDYGAYYQIQVSTSPTFTGTTMWDSGLLNEVVLGIISMRLMIQIDTRSPNFTYAGTELSLDGNKYYWRIRFADNNGSVGNWSNAANFTMNDDTPIETPTNCLLKRSVDGPQLTIMWEIVGANPTKFTIQRSINGGAFTNFNTNVSAGLREYVDNTTTMGNSYQYRIAKVEELVTSDWCLTPLLNLEESDIDFQGVNIEGGANIR